MRQGRKGGQGRQGRKFNHAIPQNKVVRLLGTSNKYVLAMVEQRAVLS